MSIASASPSYSRTRDLSYRAIGREPESATGQYADRARTRRRSTADAAAHDHIRTRFRLMKSLRSPAGSSSAALSPFSYSPSGPVRAGPLHPIYESRYTQHSSRSKERYNLDENYRFHAWKLDRLGDRGEILLRFRTRVSRTMRSLRARVSASTSWRSSSILARVTKTKTAGSLQSDSPEREPGLLSLGSNPGRDQQLRDAQAYLARGGKIENVRLRQSGKAYYFTESDR